MKVREDKCNYIKTSRVKVQQLIIKLICCIPGKSEAMYYMVHIITKMGLRTWKFSLGMT